MNSSNVDFNQSTLNSHENQENSIRSCHSQENVNPSCHSRENSNNSRYVQENFNSFYHSRENVNPSHCQEKTTFHNMSSLSPITPAFSHNSGYNSSFNFSINSSQVNLSEINNGSLYNYPDSYVTPVRRGPFQPINYNGVNGPNPGYHRSTPAGEQWEVPIHREMSMYPPSNMPPPSEPLLTPLPSNCYDSTNSSTTSASSLPSVSRTNSSGVKGVKRNILPANEDVPVEVSINMPN